MCMLAFSLVELSTNLSMISDPTHFAINIIMLFSKRLSFNIFAIMVPIIYLLTVSLIDARLREVNTLSQEFLFKLLRFDTDTWNNPARVLGNRI